MNAFPNNGLELLYPLNLDLERFMGRPLHP